MFVTYRVIISLFNSDTEQSVIKDVLVRTGKSQIACECFASKVINGGMALEELSTITTKSSLF